MAAINQICAQNLQGSTDSPQIFEKTVQSAGRTESSTPTDSVGNFELYQASREKSRKTEAVFLVGSRGSGGKSKSPQALFLLPAFSFGEAKENAVPHLQICCEVSAFQLFSKTPQGQKRYSRPQVWDESMLASWCHPNSGNF